MGKFAEVFGIGVHGSIRITLHRNDFVAGDVLSGSVELVVTSRIDRARPIELKLVGQETLEWEETRCCDKENRHCGNPEKHKNDDHKNDDGMRKRVVQEKEVFVILQDQICLDVPARSYEPGTYVFPFDYQLPHRDLVPSFRFRCFEIDHMSQVRASADYKLTARVPVDGLLDADMSHAVHPIIREDPSLKVPRSITHSKTGDVYFFIFFHKGSCELLATLEKDVMPLGGIAQVQAFVDNKSTRPVDSVRTRLMQTVTLNQFNSSRGRSEAPSTTNIIASNNSGSVEPDTRQEVLLAQPIQCGKGRSGELMPTMRSRFLSFSYELTVTCVQSWCCKDVSVTYPIVLTTKSV